MPAPAPRTAVGSEPPLVLPFTLRPPDFESGLAQCCLALPSGLVPRKGKMQHTADKFGFSQWGRPPRSGTEPRGKLVK
ncbi:hypothetical protein GCM10027570_19470 [Streptomonospora sediminis]